MAGSTGLPAHLSDGLHYHLMCGRTSYAHGHTHGYANRTSSAPSGVPHVHAYRGRTGGAVG